MYVIQKSSQSMAHLLRTPSETDNTAHSLFASSWVNDALFFAHTSNTSFGPSYVIDKNSLQLVSFDGVAVA